jgi:hypothetical protein
MKDGCLYHITGVLTPIVATIDKFGLKKQHLRKFRKPAEKFINSVAERSLVSKIAKGYQQRISKYHEKLFEFLKHDGVAWNNNNAEHAIKRFAYYRETMDGQLSETGLNEYLLLLSISVSCMYKGVSFLKFLHSQEKDIDTFCQNVNRKRSLPILEVFPEEFTFSRRKRKPNWDQKH